MGHTFINRTLCCFSSIDFSKVYGNCRLQYKYRKLLQKQCPWHRPNSLNYHRLVDKLLVCRILLTNMISSDAKQLWRLIDKPESLFAKLLKGRYYRKSDLMDPIRSYSPSYGWRSITSARSLVKKKVNQKSENMFKHFSMEWSLDPRSTPEVSNSKT